MSLPRSGFPAAPERLRFATTGQILGFGLLTSLIFMVIYPEQSLQRHLERSAQTDNVSIAYLLAWLRAKPDDHYLRILLAQRFFDKGQIREARQTLAPIFKIKTLEMKLQAKAEVLLLDILERQLWQFTPKSAEFINAQRHYLKQLRKVSHFEWPTIRLEVFAKNAYAFGDTVLARELYYQLIYNAKDVNLVWFDRIAQLYLAEGHYRSAARTYFQAMPYSSSLQQRRSYFLSGVKALQSGNLWPDAMTAAQTYAGVLLQDPRIVNATTSWYKPAGPSSYNNALAFPQGNESLVVNGVDYHVDEQYIPTMGMQMVAGRNFSKEFATDSFGIILNETAAKAFGWNNTTALNKTIVRQNSERGQNVAYHVIGVIKNFNFKSLHETISPLYMTLYPEGGLIFKTKTTDVAGLLATMKKEWDSYNTGEPFSYNFMDDLFNNTYATEQKTGTILNLFSMLTIFVACLGLFGLVTYTAEQRRKEIGVRKVLGASVTQVTQMLSKDFLKLVCIACVIAFPLSYWAMSKWLQSFAYRVSISWWVFVAAALAAIIIALLTVSFQAIKAALANPVKSLRTE